MTGFSTLFRPVPLALGLFLSAAALGAPIASEMLASPAVARTATNVIASGGFQGADRSHRARGTARLVRNADGSFNVQLRGFRVRSGPDLRVWVTDSASISSARDARRASHVDLGRLRSSRGDQTYRIPAGALGGNVRSVVIWCRAFGVLFADAPLTRS